jgi:RNA polymerase sigma-70 factor (ECF subfamily)
MKQGDATSPDSAGSLYDRYGGTVYALALRLSGDRAMADAITREAFTEVGKEAESLATEPGATEARLFSLARDRGLDMVRERRAAAGTVLAPPLEDPAADLAERRRYVRHAFAGLSPAQRSALELAFFDGLSVAETAARLGEPVEVVKTSLRQALNLMRRVLAPLLPAS